MNDPHVVALLYQIEHGRGVDYGEAKPIDHEENGFRVEIANEQVCFEFKEHYETKDAARKAIEDYIRVWEFDASLREGPNHFKLRFKRAHIEDRKPTPGVMDTSVSITSGVPKVSVMATVSKPYPSPPSSGLKLIPDVQTMYDRYKGYLQDREPLASMAYFCLTILVRSTKKKGNEKKTCRKLASEMYRIELEVLNKIGHLASERGGQQARKASGKDNDLTYQDRRFLEEAIKAVIRRAAEKAHASDGNIQKISLSDIPSI